MSRVSTIDATGAHILGDAVIRLRHRGITVLLSGVDPRHEKVMTTVGGTTYLYRNGLVFPDTPTAIDYARHLSHQPAAASEATASSAGE